MFYIGTTTSGGTIGNHYTTGQLRRARKSVQKPRKSAKGLGKLICLPVNR